MNKYYLKESSMFLIVIVLSSTILVLLPYKRWEPHHKKYATISLAS